MSERRKSIVVIGGINIDRVAYTGKLADSLPSQAGVDWLCLFKPSHIYSISGSMKHNGTKRAHESEDPAKCSAPYA